MEASSTTVNISGGNVADKSKLIASDVGVIPLKHSHGPNFGRYVEGCAACIAKYPNGPQKRTRTAKPATDKDAEIARLKAELSKSYTQQVEKPKTSSDDATRELAAIMLRREAKQLLKDEAIEVRHQEARADFLRVAKEQEAQKAAREANCNHKKDNGRTAIAASQIHNDGMTHPFCMRCFKTWPARRPSHENMPTSVEA